MEKKYKILLIIAVIVIFSLGYYLRAYFPLYKALPLSPYEAFRSEVVHSSIDKGLTKDFSEKATRYPTTYILQRLLDPLFGDLYIVYILGAIVIFFLGKEITNKTLGGFLAFSLYCLAPENLLQYMRIIGTSGMCYVFMWAALLFLIRYLKNKKNYDIVLFIIFSLLALTSYHTGATAMIMLIIGLAISLIYSKQIDKKILFSFIGIIAFYLIWIYIFDLSQIVLIKNSFLNAGFLKIFFIIVAVILLLVFLFLLGKIKFLQSEWLPLIFLIISAVLIFSKFNFFNFLLNLGVKNYYVSSVSLNNYIAQALLTHVYILLLLPALFKKQLRPRGLFLRGWLFGLILVFGGLMTQNFYARIFDYSFPLTFILFALFWCKKKKFRILIITLTIILLVASQLMIYQDPFTMRRYYNQNELDSTDQIIKLNLNGTIASDLRTAALFSYFGKKDIRFGEADTFHDALFYEKNLDNQEIDYVILSESMKTIIYSTNFPTTPLSEQDFEYYRNNFKEVYNDKQMYVYKIS